MKKEPEGEVQTENPGEHSETETWTAEKKTDEEKTNEKEKSSAGNSVKTDHVYSFITVQYLIFSYFQQPQINLMPENDYQVDSLY